MKEAAAKTLWLIVKSIYFLVLFIIMILVATYGDHPVVYLALVVVGHVVLTVIFKHLRPGGTT